MRVTNVAHVYVVLACTARHARINVKCPREVLSVSVFDPKSGSREETGTREKVAVCSDTSPFANTSSVSDLRNPEKDVGEVKRLPVETKTANDKVHGREKRCGRGINGKHGETKGNRGIVVAKSYQRGLRKQE